ncbi:MAG TPA: dirigent protein [Mycobacteriales bacterium]
MRRSTWLVGLVVAGVVGGGAVTASAAPTAPAPGPAARPDTVLHYDISFRPQSENYVDIGTPGPGIGDLLVFQDRILDRSGRQVGVEGGTCTITTLLADGFQTHCAGTVLLPGGSIAFQGLVTDAPEKRMAVVGGTGRYRNAAGELTVLELGHDEAGTLTVRLTAR